MSDLIQDLANAKSSAHNGRGACKLCRLLADLPDDDRRALADAAAGTIGARTLADILRRNGMAVSRDTIMKHRREDHTS